IPDLATSQSVWQEWRALFEKAGYRALAPEISSGGKPEHFVERTTEQMLELIDEMTLEPHLIGVGHGALVALCVADERAPAPARDRAARGAREGAAIGVVAIGGPAIPLDQLGIRAGTGRSRPLL